MTFNNNFFSIILIEEKDLDNIKKNYKKIIKNL